MTMVVSSRGVEPEFQAADAPEAQHVLLNLSLSTVFLRPNQKTVPTASPSAVKVADVDRSDSSSAQKRAQEAFLNRDYVKAEAEFTRAIALDPHSAKLLYDRGATRLALNEQGAAKSDFEGALKIDPKDAFSLFALGRLALAHDDIAHTESYFRAALDAAVDPRAMMLRAAEAYDDTSHLSQAAKAFEALASAETELDLKKDFFEAFDSRGLAELKMGAFGPAIADYDRALALRPNSAASLYGRGWAKRRGERTAEAEQDIGAAKSLDPKVEGRFADWGVRP
jgi:tetratricopeptide (TPR) repeat protein